MGFDKRENGEVIFFSDYDLKHPNLPEHKIEPGNIVNLTYKNQPVIVKIISKDGDKFTGIVENEPYPYLNHQEEVIFWEDEIFSVEKQ